MAKAPHSFRFATLPVPAGCGDLPTGPSLVPLDAGRSFHAESNAAWLPASEAKRPRPNLVWSHSMYAIRFLAPDGSTGLIESISTASGRALVRIADRWFDAADVTIEGHGG